MAKLFKLSEENEKFIMNVIYELGLDHQMNFELMGVNNAKELFKVSMTSQITEYLADKPQSVCITVYEEAFEMLDEKTKKLLVNDVLNNVVYDFEKDKVIIGVPTIKVTMSGRAKWGDDLINAAETGLLVMEQIEERRKEEKEMAKAAKKRKGTKV